MVNAYFIFFIFKYNKKGERIMGIFFAWFQCDDVAELKKMREEAKTEEEKKAIDEKIAELESKN